MKINTHWQYKFGLQGHFQKGMNLTRKNDTNKESIEARTGNFTGYLQQQESVSWMTTLLTPLLYISELGVY